MALKFEKPTKGPIAPDAITHITGGESSQRRQTLSDVKNDKKQQQSKDQPAAKPRDPWRDIVWYKWFI